MLDLLLLVDVVTGFVLPLFDLDWDSFTHFGEEETGLLADSGGKASLCYYKKKISYLRPIWLIFKNTQQQQQFIKFKK